MAAIKKVLSPSSETIITDIAATKAWINPKLAEVNAMFCSCTAGGGLGIFCKKKKKREINLCQTVKNKK